MALLSNDLFFVNRSNTTYKIEASEIGDFIVNGDTVAGTPGYINNGKLDVINDGEVFDLTSANADQDRILEFDDNFDVLRTVKGACVGINFENLKTNLICPTDSGFLENNCGCLAIDPEWISNNIDLDGIIDNLICIGGGLINDGGCISIDPDFIGGGVIPNPPAGGGSCIDDSQCDPKYICMGGKCVPDPDQWPAGSLWWHNDAIDGRLYVNYDDGNSKQWVDASPQDNQKTIKVSNDGVVEEQLSFNSVVSFNGTTPLVLNEGTVDRIDVRERLDIAKKTFQDLQIAVEDSTDFSELKAAMLSALSYWAPEDG